LKDIIALHDEKIEGEPLLAKVMENGKIVCSLPSLDEIRKRAMENVSKLPWKYKKLKRAPRYPVMLSPKLKRLMRELMKRIKKEEVVNS